VNNTADVPKIYKRFQLCMPSCRHCFLVRCGSITLHLPSTNTTPNTPRRMTPWLHLPFDHDIPPIPSDADADADEAASDGGYSSDGDISSMYGAYSQYKTCKHKRWTPIPLSSRQECRTRTQSERRLSLSRAAVKLIFIPSSSLQSSTVGCT